MTIRILIVDDSPTARRFLAAIVQSDSEFELVGMATDGVEGVRLANELRPDVILMDLNMPGLMGHEATRQIMTECPTHIVICTSGTTGEDAANSYEAIKAGALAAVEKPTGLDNMEERRAVVSTVKLMANVPVRRATPAGTLEQSPPQLITGSSQWRVKVIGIGASSGGPAVLQATLSHLPADFPIPILAVVHTTSGFAEGLVDWLASNLALPVRLARHGERLPTNTVLVAPDDYHLRVNPLRQIELTQTLPVKGQRPSAAILFQSMANVFGPAALGVLLSNLGPDGHEALHVLRASGGRLIIQHDSPEPPPPLAPGPAVYHVPAERLATTLLEQIA